MTITKIAPFTETDKTQAVFNYYNSKLNGDKNMFSVIVLGVSIVVSIACCFIFGDGLSSMREPVYFAPTLIGGLISGIYELYESFKTDKKNKESYKAEENTSAKAASDAINPSEPKEEKNTYEALLYSFNDSAAPAQNLPSKIVPQNVKPEKALDYVFEFSKRHSDAAVSLHIFPSKENLSVVAFDILLITSCNISELVSTEASLLSALFALYKDDGDFVTYKYTLKTTEKKSSMKQVYEQIVSLSEKYESLYNVSFYILDYGVKLMI